MIRIIDLPCFMLMTLPIYPGMWLAIQCTGLCIIASLHNKPVSLINLNVFRLWKKTNGADVAWWLGHSLLLRGKGCPPHQACVLAAAFN